MIKIKYQILLFFTSYLIFLPFISYGLNYYLIDRYIYNTNTIIYYNNSNLKISKLEYENTILPIGQSSYSQYLLENNIKLDNEIYFDEFSSSTLND